jgi:hypothetical protein
VGQRQSRGKSKAAMPHILVAFGVLACASRFFGLVLGTKESLKYLLRTELALLYFALRLTYLGTDSITCGTDN